MNKCLVLSINGQIKDIAVVYLMYTNILLLQVDTRLL